MRRAPAIALLLALAVAVPALGHGLEPLPDPAPRSGWLAAPRVDAACPTAVDPGRFPTADRLYADNAKMAAFGRRPTGSPNHARFVAWIDRQLRKLPGASIDRISYPINRWSLRSLRLRSGGETIRDAGPVPYSRRTPKRGVAGPLVYLPPDQPISAADVRGKVVVRDTVTTSVPNAAISALSWWTYDPEAVLIADIADDYERENAGEARILDLQEAAAGGARALLFAHDLPREQVGGQYAPYEGLRWPVPAVYLGADEGARVKQLAAEGKGLRVQMATRSQAVRTRMLIATLPGLTDESTLVQSHTDGMNAVWDNGPVAMLSMARYFARLGKGCRERTLQFAFTTGHLYQHFVAPDRDGSAEQLAKEVDRRYNQGKIAFVLPLEHLGARSWEPVERTDGGPGHVLEPTGGTEPTSIFIGESPALIETALQVVTRNDLRETIALRGIDLPSLQIPPNDNYGGEGNPYQHHLIPQVALVTAPWTLFLPRFSIAELIDKELLHRQALTFTDLLHATAPIPKELLAGGFTGYREGRELTCGTALETLGFVRHCNAP